MVDCQVLNYIIKAYVLWDFVQFYLEHTCPFEVGYKRVALVCNEGANSTTLDRWDMVTALLRYFLQWLFYISLFKCYEMGPS